MSEQFLSTQTENVDNPSQLELDNYRIFIKGESSFTFFLNNIFSQSFDTWIPGKHLDEWAQTLQDNSHVALLSARLHGKSTVMYAYVMWKLLYSERDLEVLYISYNGEMAGYHTQNIKRLIRCNPFFDELVDLKGAAEHVLAYCWQEDARFKRGIKRIEPAGIKAFKRGRHPDLVICDDILADPQTEMSIGDIRRINRLFFQDVMSLPKEEGELMVVGTAQHSEDLFFKLRDLGRFSWGAFPAIEDFGKKEVLWPERFTFERLIEKRDKEIGEKAFMKEYMCSPVSSEEAFFRREEIEQIVNPELGNLKWTDKVNCESTVYAGWDIGKKRHPSHIAVFKEQNDGTLAQIHSKFLDDWNYTDQVNYINTLIKNHAIQLLFYDNTQGVMDSFMEKQELDNRAIPQKFTVNYKNRLAVEFEKRVQNQAIELLNDRRMIDQILLVNNDLRAFETREGHGDSFWSIALAVNAANHKPMEIEFGSVRIF